MQPMWVCLFSGMSFEETFENTQRRKIKQMQTMLLFLFSSPRPSIYQQSRTTSAMKDNCHPWNLSGGNLSSGNFFSSNMIPWYWKLILCHCEGAEKMHFSDNFCHYFLASSDDATCIYWCCMHLVNDFFGVKKNLIPKFVSGEGGGGQPSRPAWPKISRSGFFWENTIKSEKYSEKSEKYSEKVEKILWKVGKILARPK